MAKLFGPDCKFLSVSLLNFDDSRALMQELIRTINKENPSKIKSLKKSTSKSSSKLLNLSRRNSRVNSEDNGGQTPPPAGTPVSEKSPEIVPASESENGNVQEKENKPIKKFSKSKVCVVM